MNGKTAVIAIDEIISNKFYHEDGIFYVGDKTFGYSDGNKAEEYILEAVGRAVDISSDSSELETSIIDWSSKYHLSRERANCYRSMNFPKEAIVLEIGSGCGSITRYLAENVKTVVALEGSARRAKITRSRTRDLDNVVVICASFEEVLFKRLFSYVICNGVLEYASLFSASLSPINDFISSVSKLVDGSGSLVVAIENKLGLRYFSSGREEHTGIMYDSCEDYPSFKGGARTFSKLEITDLFSVHFKSIEHFIPLPDYKLPTGLIREVLTTEVDCAELFSATDMYNFGSAMPPLMHERLVWGSISSAGLLSQLSNSFLIVVGSKPSKLFSANWLGDIYSNNRKSEYISKTQIIKSDKGEIETIKRRVKNRQSPSSSLLTHIELNEKWQSGISIHSMMSRVFMEKDKVPFTDKINNIVSIWWNILDTELDENNNLDGVCIDNIWQNCLFDGKNSFFIDSEWRWNEKIPALLLVYRSVVGFISKDIHYLNRWKLKNRMLSQYYIIKVVAEICDIEFSVKRLILAIVINSKFVKETQGITQSLSFCLLRLFVPVTLLSRMRLISTNLKRNITRVKNRIY